MSTAFLLSLGSWRGPPPLPNPPANSERARALSDAPPTQRGTPRSRVQPQRAPYTRFQRAAGVWCGVGVSVHDWAPWEAVRELCVCVCVCPRAPRYWVGSPPQGMLRITETATPHLGAK